MSPTTAKWSTVWPSDSRRARARNALAALLTAVGLALPGTAEASGFLGARFGADHGTPVGANPFSIYFNPAALGAVEGTQLSLDAAVVYRIASYERSANDLSPSSMVPGTAPYNEYVRSNTGKGSVANILALPFAGVATDFGGSKLLHGGLGIYIPFGGLASWDRNDSFKSSATAPGGYDGPQRWFNISGRIISVYGTAALALTIPETRLSIGVNASIANHEVQTVRARNPDGSDDTATQTGRLIEGRSLIDASGITFSGAIGLYYEIIPNKATVGASYTARPGLGQMRLKGTLKTQFGQDAKDKEGNEPIELLQTLPDVWRLGGAYRVSDKVELRLDGEYVTWSNFQRQCLVNANLDAKCRLYADGSEADDNGGKVIQVIKRAWQDAFAVRFGVGYFVSPSTELFGSVLYDSSAVPDATLDPTFIDSDKIHWVLGVRQNIGKRFALAGSFNHVYFFERDTTAKAPDQQTNEFFRLREDSRQPSAGGKYNQQFFYLNVNGTVYF